MSFEWIKTKLDQSLGLRWVVLVCSVAALGSFSMLVATDVEMSRYLAQQDAAIHDFAEERMVERLSAEINLVNYRLDSVFSELESGLSALARQPNTFKAIRSRNDVVIAETIGRSLRDDGFDGGIVLDDKLNVIGADRTGAELLAAHAVLRQSELLPIFKDLVANNDVARPNTHQYIGPIDLSVAALVLAPSTSFYGMLLAYPVFDDFGEPIGLIVAYRSLKYRELTLTDFANRTKSAVALMLHGEPITMGGITNSRFALKPTDHPKLLHFAEGKLIGHCSEPNRQLKTCVMRPEQEIRSFQRSIMEIGQAQMVQSRLTLAGLGAMVLLSLMLLIIILTGKLTRPLKDITDSVLRVSSGEWRVEVMHTTRKDEIGLVARAIEAMQNSLIERDRMRQEIVRIDAINQRRLVLDNAVSRFEDGMSVVMKNILDTITSLSEADALLGKAAREAAVQVEAIRDVSENTANQNSVVKDATQHLSRTIQHIGSRARATTDVVHATEGRANEAEACLDGLTQLTKEIETVMSVVQEVVADLNHISLAASLDAAKQVDAGGSIGTIAQDIRVLSERSFAAMQAMSGYLGQIEDMSEKASRSIGAVKGVLGSAIHETAEIAVAVEQQDAATREISEGLQGITLAMASLVESVGHLRQNMAEAHEASSDFVQTAKRMSEDARMIDKSVRSFMREVAA